MPGVTVRRADAEVIPPLSDHLGFWEAGVPFMLLTGGRSGAYHTPWDTPDRLDWGRVDAVSRWLETFVRDQCARPEARVRFAADGRDDLSTIDTMRALLDPLAEMVPLARAGLDQLAALRHRCDARGRLGDGDRTALHGLVETIESALA